MDRYWSDWKFPGIYAIVHITSGRRYVGQAIDISKRVERHMVYHKWTSRHLSNAIKLYGADQFEAIVLEVVDDRSDLNSREQWWIDTLCAASPDLGYNIRPDASSQSGFKVSDSTREKISKAARKRFQNPEYYARFMKMQHDPEFLAARSARTKKLYENEEYRAAASVIQKERYRNPEEREKNRVATNKFLKNPDNYAKYMEIRRTPEYRSKMSESVKKRWENPDARERQSAAQKAAWARRRAAKQGDVL